MNENVTTEEGVTLSELMKEYALEPSTNTHNLRSEQGFKVQTYVRQENIQKIINVGEKAFIDHGEHGTMVITAPAFWAIRQVELNPITGEMMPVVD